MKANFDPYVDATNRFDPEWDLEASNLLSQKFSKQFRGKEEIRVEAFLGNECFLLRGQLGTQEKAEVFEFFAYVSDMKNREPDYGLLLDFFDGVLEYYFKHQRDARLPLDFTSRHFEHVMLWARQEFRNFEAERLAEAWLDSDEFKNHSKIE